MQLMSCSYQTTLKLNEIGFNLNDISPLSLVQQWFREVHKIEISILYFPESDNYHYILDYINDPFRKLMYKRTKEEAYQNTYNECLETAILKLCDRINKMKKMKEV
jgi:hypothetical protein